MYNSVELISQAFKDCDKRVFSFKANPCQNDLILYSRAKKAVNIAARKSNANLTELMLLTYILDKARKINIDGQVYIYTYEARWDSNATLADICGTSDRQIRRAFASLSASNLLCSNGRRGVNKRCYRLGDEIARLARLTDSQLANYLMSQNDKDKVKETDKYANDALNQFDYIMGKSPSYRQLDHGHQVSFLHGHQVSFLHGHQVSIEVTKEKNKIDNNTGVQPYPQSQPGVIEQQTDKHKVDQQSCSIAIKIKKRDVIKAWQEIAYAKDERGKSIYPYLGSNFAHDLYESIRHKLGHTINAQTVSVIGIDILTACTSDTRLADFCKRARARKRLDEFWRSETIKLAASEIAAKVRREQQEESEMY